MNSDVICESPCPLWTGTTLLFLWYATTVSVQLCPSSGIKYMHFAVSLQMTMMQVVPPLEVTGYMYYPCPVRLPISF